MTDEPTAEEPYLRVEEVAERLGLPLPVLMRRVEAGDIPSRREEADDGPHFWLRLTDLGIDAAAGDDPPEERDEGAAHVEDAIQSSFNPGEPSRFADDAPWSLDGGLPSRWPGMDHEPGPEEPAKAADQRRREPQQPPDWLRMPTSEKAQPELDLQPELAPTADTLEARAQPAAPVENHPDSAEPPVAAHLPVPQAAHVDLLEPSSPRGDLAVMSLDARELVAGLLDRWERTLEQRIYTEQRQRFESELTARQSAVKQLQMELHTARAEHAAAQAEKDRLLAAKERELADREREVAEARRLAAEAGRRRRWFRRTDD